MIYGLPERLRELREKFGISQRDAAERVGIAPTTISGYERGERTPDVLTVLKFSYVYNCSVDYLLGKSHEDDSHIYIDVTELSGEQRKVIDELVKVMKRN
ncbi:MAG: helix-turn-helix transcriptional regulator [Oscillospiraceae bacterium]|nr:helix-turn-helix transcriptional regulator [Oscillospiraceae bacterium]